MLGNRTEFLPNVFHQNGGLDFLRMSSLLGKGRKNGIPVLPQEKKNLVCRQRLRDSETMLYLKSNIFSKFARE